MVTVSVVATKEEYAEHAKLIARKRDLCQRLGIATNDGLVDEAWYLGTNYSWREARMEQLRTEVARYMNQLDNIACVGIHRVDMPAPWGTW